MKYYPVLFVALLSGCISQPDPIPVEYMTEASICVGRVSSEMTARHNSLSSTPVDARDAMLERIVVSLIERDQNNPYDACFSAIVAFYNAQGQVVTANSGIIRSTLDMAGLPLSILAGGKALDWMMSNAGTTTLTSTNSDVLFKSGNDGTSNSTGRSGQGSNTNTPVDNTDNSVETTDESVTDSNNSDNDSVNPTTTSGNINF